MEVSSEDDEIPTVSPEISRLSHAFPFGTEGNAEKAMDLLFNYLPSQPRAWSLCETYMEHAAWSFRPIKRDEMIDEILSPTYKALKGRQAGGENENALHTVSSHKLAVLFLVFALGALVDLTLEPCESMNIFCPVHAYTIENLRQCRVRDLLPFEPGLLVPSLRFRLPRDFYRTSSSFNGGLSRYGG